MNVDINEVRLEGKVARLKVNSTTTGKDVANFNVETRGRGKYPDKHAVVAWEDLAQAVAAAGDGSRVSVTGRLQTRSYESGGVKKYVTEVIADRLSVLTADTATQNEEPAF